MKKHTISLLSSLLLVCSASQADKLTTEQCEEYKYADSLHLTDKQKKKVLKSCKKRYSSENALGNCTAFEGEDYIKKLKKLAKKQCK